MAVNQKKENDASLKTPATHSNDQQGIVTVNDDQNPSREERDAKITNEPDTARLSSERQSVEEGKQKK